MTDGTTLTTNSNIALITIDNPPVNGLSTRVRKALITHLDTISEDENLAAVIITGADRMFSAGADITEFGSTSLEPHLSDVITTIENFTRPIIAAIHGVAAGGGLEIALGCHYRVGISGTRVGLPEVNLGIVPGAGGTQRLPRLIGAEHALKLITSGKLISIEEACSIGLIDKILPDDLIPHTLDFVHQQLQANKPIRRTKDLDPTPETRKEHKSTFSHFRSNLEKRVRGFDAPLACVDCIEAAVTLPFQEGLAREREIFSQLLASDQSKAQRHVFFGEREVTKIHDVPRTTKTLPIKQAAVVGAGTMGSGIVMAFANAGIPVTLIDTSEDATKHALTKISSLYEATVSKGRLTSKEMTARLASITSHTNIEQVRNADIVVEAVFEELTLKQDVFKTLDATCKQDAILATNTSTLDIDSIASATRRPDRVIGTHFFSPANVMRLIENVRGSQTSSETIATTMKLSKQLNKVGVLVGNCDGFVGNRMLASYIRQAEFLLEEGALPEEIDRVIYDFGFAMGPFQMADMAGLDVSWFIRQRQAKTRPSTLRYSFLPDRICELNRFGLKTGAGWYRYENGVRTPIPDPKITRLIEQTSNELGIKRRNISPAEILNRCLYPLINEGAKILDEGIATRASDIDIIWIYGYGFPRYKGGPMFWANTLGPSKIYDSLLELHEKHGDGLKPTPLLKQVLKT